ncbi:hypothetical protein CHS0354_022600 [Potamilus streckersoni]|uniref:Glycosyltransferase family 92 protein n=1 Tax=Potamilus streckersoni TaxID=2493646 RepID=A0AAE0VPY4_9BIVA|nr:hypothetical protein CHS0354_022600 [Potamilus streckersoni]
MFDSIFRYIFSSFVFPSYTDVIPREPLRRSKLVASDEQILVYYCQDRLAGYSFIGVIDFDEFIVPQQDRNFKELMRHLMEKYKNTASFTFLVEYYIRNWGIYNSPEHLIPIEYIQRTAAMKDRVKNIIVRDRFEPGSITTHTVIPRRGFKSVIVPTDLAVLKHYRACRDDWKPKSDCINGTDAFQRFTDDSLKKKLERMIVKDNYRNKLNDGDDQDEDVDKNKLNDCDDDDEDVDKNKLDDCGDEDENVDKNKFNGSDDEDEDVDKNKLNDYDDEDEEMEDYHL